MVPFNISWYAALIACEKSRFFELSKQKEHRKTHWREVAGREVATEFPEHTEDFCLWMVNWFRFWDCRQVLSLDRSMLWRENVLIGVERRDIRIIRVTAAGSDDWTSHYGRICKVSLMITGASISIRRWRYDCWEGCRICSNLLVLDSRSLSRRSSDVRWVGGRSFVTRQSQSG